MSKEVSFWEGNHPLQDQYNRLWNDNVPPQGECDTIKGEIVRCAGRLFYEYCNNGNCNASDIDYGPGKMYMDMLDYIEEHVPDSEQVVSRVKDIIKIGDHGNYFGTKNIEVYNTLTEKCVLYAMDLESLEREEKIDSILNES